MTLNRRNVMTGCIVAAAICLMVGMSFAAVPLYRLFCAATGYAGTPNVGLAAAPGAELPGAGPNTAQTIRVRFNADTNPGLPWKFAPDQTEVSLALGEQQVAFYHASNQSNRPVSGMALYNVTPEKTGKYFHKTACFCFSQQTLEAGQTMEFPVSFWVDPAIRSDPNTSDVKVITLSYTFFRALDDAAKSGALAKAGPHIGPLSATEAGPRPNAN